MTLSQAKHRCSVLKKEINTHNKLYYISSQPIISDSQYDALLKELIQLEAEFPSIQTHDSPTQRVGVKVRGDLPTLNHRVPMLSLDNSYNVEELKLWHQRVLKILKVSAVQMSVELKIDGVSVALIYRKGRLELGITRGDGISGEDVTHNIKTIRVLPLTLPKNSNSELEVRGEVYMDKNDFMLLNKERLHHDEDVFANPRNAASGSLKLLDASIASKRRLKFFVHSCVLNQDLKDITTQGQFLHMAQEHGLPIDSHSRICENIDEVMAFCNEYTAKRDSLSFDVDGVVIKINDIRFQQQLGFTAKSPRWAVAYKFPAYQVTTRIRNIVVQVGRTGVLTPVAELEPVTCGGVSISRATLHNFDEIKRLKVNIGDDVLLERAGDVIPKIIKVVSKHSHDFFKQMLHCPACQGQVIQDEQGVALRCINPACPQQIERGLLHFASRLAMDIEGLGEAVVKQLLDKKLIRSISDIYKLTEEDFLTLELFAQKKAQNLLQAIEASKKQPLARLIFALGINNIGAKGAKTLAARFGHLLPLQQASLEQLNNIDDIGPVTAQAVVDFFSNRYSQNLLKELDALGVNMQQPKNEHGTQFEDKKFVFTGELDGISREEAENLVIAQGGKVSNSVSVKTHYVVVGLNPGSKAKKALELNIPVLTQLEFMNLINSN